MKLQLYGFAVAIGLALVFAVYLKGRSDGAEKVRLEAERALAAQVAKTLETERQLADLNRRLQDELQPKLDSAESRARTLARRLQVCAGRPALPPNADPAPGADAGSGEPGSDGGIGAATERVFGACARDAERLNTWREWWRAAEALSRQRDAS